MELKNYSFLFEESSKHGAVGAIVYPHSGGQFYGSLMQDFEVLVLILHEEGPTEKRYRHSAIGELRYQILYMDWIRLTRCLITGEDRSVIEAFLHGDILWDKGGKIKAHRDHIQQFGSKLRKQKIFYEFSQFLHTYLDAKRWIKDGEVIDAYQSVLESLNHWARIVVLEKGVSPERAVWTQIRDMDRSVYKLYEELTMSKETLEQRVELILLACEFSVLSKMESSCSLLLDILRSSNKPWSLHELMKHPDLCFMQDEIPLLLRKLVYRSIIRETESLVPFVTDGGREIKYCAK
ncbi:MULTISPECIES: nucleotidyltransferase-like protein [unclassified Paenibacillus]|uniref:Nucleotidyltransferase-like protein n=1 Tax=Paenibacillus provencensis TaxID=441151 RepID=A0ABW3Q2S5_9BACL|nr:MULTISPECIES: nucleotidyltransferase-like protein [unclassified Paenibacillus]MCM3130372.1 nucleotidyltransferase-like protein [Paenibacillus sp. MER 78]SFS93143.1 Nucleotidyltransferase-like [Paenibacillus sp. 453mf]